METIRSLSDWQAANSTLDHLNLISISLDLDFTIETVSPYTFRKTGWEAEDLVGKSFSQVLSPET